MKRYKIIKCKYCGRVFMTQAITSVKCPFCGKSTTLSNAYKLGNIIYESDSWSEAAGYMDEKYVIDSLDYARKKYISRNKEDDLNG